MKGCENCKIREKVFREKLSLKYGETFWQDLKKVAKKKMRRREMATNYGLSVERVRQLLKQV